MLSEDAALMSHTYQLKSEGYAVGEQDGEPVGDTSPYYESNSKYYSEQSADSAEDADASALVSEGYAVGEQNGTPVTSGSPYYHNNAKYYSENLINILPTDTASGAIASFPDGSDLFDYLSCIVDIEPVQAGSGTPSPDNVRPITGWTGCEVSQAGVNVWDEEWELGGIDASTGLPYADNNLIRSKNFSPIVGNSDYCFVTNGNTFVVHWYDSNENQISYNQRFTPTTPPILTAPQNAKYLKIRMWSAYGTTYKNDVSINYPSTDTSYHAYNGQIYPVSWQTEAGTVYGGTVDLVTGVLTADMKYDQMTYAYLSSLTSPYIDFASNITQVGGNAVWVRNWNYTDYKANIDGGIKAKCNAFPVSMHNKNIFSSQYRIYFGVGSMTSVAEFLTAVQALETGGGGLWIAHELQTPTTYQLDPVQVACLLGQNNVWADCGDIEEVKYKADVQLWVDKKLGE